MGYRGGTDPGQVLGGTGYGQGTGQYDDQMFEGAAGESSSALAVEVTVRRKTGMVAGFPGSGVQERPAFKNVLIRAYVYSLTIEDVSKPGGIFEYGDVILGLEEFAVRSLDGEIRGGESENDQEADRVLWKGLEYRVVGRVDFSPIGPENVVRQILCRKVGRAL